MPVCGWVLSKKTGGFTLRRFHCASSHAKKLKLPGQHSKPNSGKHWAILDVVKIEISPPTAGDHYNNVAKQMVIHFTWLWQVSDVRLEKHEPRAGQVTLWDVVNTVPPPYNNVHVVALRQFCAHLARKPALPGMQMQAMFGTCDPAEFQ